jgi:hypothetical protein
LVVNKEGTERDRSQQPWEQSIFDSTVSQHCFFFFYTYIYIYIFLTITFSSPASTKF